MGFFPLVCLSFLSVNHAGLTGLQRLRLWLPAQNSDMRALAGQRNGLLPPAIDLVPVHIRHQARRAERQDPSRRATGDRRVTRSALALVSSDRMELTGAGATDRTTTSSRIRRPPHRCRVLPDTIHLLRQQTRRRLLQVSWASRYLMFAC